MRVADWFKGRAGRARPRGCRGRRLGTGDLADKCHAASAQGDGRSVASPPCSGDLADEYHAARAGSHMDSMLGAAKLRMAMAIVQRSGAVS